jgi:hypothetical protein
MKVLYERVAGIDVHKEMIKVAIRSPPRPSRLDVIRTERPTPRTDDTPHPPGSLPRRRQ